MRKESKRAGKEPVKRSASAKGPRRPKEDISKSRRRHGEEHDASVSGNSPGRREDSVGEKKAVSDALETQYKELTFKYMEIMNDMTALGERGTTFIDGLLFPAVRLHAQGK